MGKGISRQALALGPRILAVDALLTRHPTLSVIEVHPELSFAELSGRVPDPKKSARGVGQRIAALQRWLPATSEAVGQAPAGVPIDDALDALAALWSARRWLTGAARTLPPGAVAPPFIVI